MHRLRQCSVVRLIVLPFTLTLWLAACSRWVPLETRPPPSDRLAGADVVRVYLNDGRVIELEHGVEVVGDSLIGYLERPRPYVSEPKGRTAIPLAEIDRLEEKQPKAGATALVIAGSILGGLLIIGAIAYAIDPPFGS